MEKIGYIEKDKLNLTNGLNNLDNLLQSEIKFGYRNVVEEYNNVVQPICAGVIITKDNQILIINKSVSATGNQSPEKDKTLLYIGGHLDIADSTDTNLQTFLAGMKREIMEEIGFEIANTNTSTPIVTYTPSQEKSAKHIGIIFPVIIDKTFDTTFTDGKCKFVSINNLRKISNLEEWSEIILENIVDKQPEKNI